MPRLRGIRRNPLPCYPLDASLPWTPNEPAIRDTYCRPGRDVVFWCHFYLSTHLDGVPSVRKGKMPATML